jgi:hypothetical protein
MMPCRPTPFPLRILAVVSTALAAGTVGISAQTVHGRTTAEDTGLPLQGVEVALTTQDGDVVSRVLSDSAGRYTLRIPEDGAYKISADLFGYLRLESPLAALTVDQSPLVDFEMPSDPIELDEVRVSVERREELVSRARSYGVQAELLGQRLVTVEAIERRETAVDFGQVLQWQSVAGMRVRRGADSGDGPWVCVMLTRSRGCAITVLDGSVVSSEVAGSIPPETLGGIMVLTPVEATTSFGTDGGNGAVLIFTKGALIRR